MVDTKNRLALAVGLALAASPSIAAADDFAAGSLIVPMDTTYQDKGIFEAYGLVYELLRQGVPVRWVIKIGKKNGDIDFTATSTDVRTGVSLQAHGYRGGPWVIDAADAAEALPFIETWQQKNVNTTVHEASAAFTGDVSRTLVVAPTIAMMADGNQKIARKYMIAAKIPDSTGDPLWPDSSPDMLDPDELTGPTEDNHTDGKLFDAEGDPVYCQFMSMHWAVKDAEANQAADKKRKELVEARNQAEAMAYQTEKSLKELGDKAPAADKAEAEAAIAEVRGLAESEDAEALKRATEKLSAVAMKLGEAVYKAQAEQAAPQDGAGPGGDQPQQGKPDDGNVVDAEFEEVKDDKKKSA